jgi:membrane-associated protein
VTASIVLTHVLVATAGVVLGWVVGGLFAGALQLNIGAILGDNASFLIGRRYGKRVVTKWEWARRRLEPAMARAEEHFRRYGGRTLFVGRWVGALRAVVPVVAGAARMPYIRFLPWNVAGSLSWVATVVTLGYAFGDEIARLVDRFGLALSVVVVSVLAGRFAWKRWRRRQMP